MSDHPPTSLYGLGFAVLGAGLGLQAASVFRLASRVGLATPWDARVFGLVFVVLIVLGAVLFGPLARTSARKGWVLAAAAAAGGSVLALAVIAATTTPLGFKAHCARFGTDASLAGTPLVDASAALVMFILPGFGLGAYLASEGPRTRKMATAAGLFLGWFAYPFVFDRMVAVGWKDAGAAGLVVHGALIAGLGIAMAAANAVPAIGLGTRVGLVLAALAAALPISPVEVYPPWQRFAVKPLEIFETANGQYTVLPTGDGGRQVLLNQRAVSPTSAELFLEAACIQRSAEVLAEAEVPWPPKALVIGLLTPERADLLEAFGIETIYRSALWHDDMERVEKAVGWESSPPGKVIPPSEFPSVGADVVISFPVGTYASAGWSLGVLSSIPHRQMTIWLPTDVGVQYAPDDAHLLLASKGLERFAFGWTHLAPEGSDLPAPSVTPMTLAHMSTRPEARPFEVLRNVAQGAEPALALHAADQHISSPFESPLEQIELVPEALAAWRDLALNTEGELDGYLRGVLDGAASALMAQDRVPWVFEFLEPVVERFPGFLGPQIALAWAEAQELQFEAAAERLRPLVAALPDRRDLRVALADALVAMDDPEGRKLAQGLLRDDPKNPRLFGLARGVRGMTTLGAPGGYESLSQGEALALSDGAVLGTITGISVQEVDPGDGAPLFLTTLTVTGTELASGAKAEETQHEVIFLGGFTDPEHGSFSSTAPPAHRTAPGRQIFYYYQTQSDIAGGVSGHVLLRGRAGLFTAFAARDGDVIVQGRGNAAAIPYNLVRDELPAPH